MSLTSEHALHELVLSRSIDAAPAQLFRAWTEAEILKQWFAPTPWTTPHAALNVRPGGTSLVVMRNPEGQEFPYRSVYLDVVPDAKLVSTDAYVCAWEPSPEPFMTLILTFEPEGEGTRYTARARHWTAQDRARHEAMGFYDGWGRCTDQLAALVARL